MRAGMMITPVVSNLSFASILKCSLGWIGRLMTFFWSKNNNNFFNRVDFNRFIVYYYRNLLEKQMAVKILLI